MPKRAVLGTGPSAGNLGLHPTKETMGATVTGDISSSTGVRLCLHLKYPPMGQLLLYYDGPRSSP